MINQNLKNEVRFAYFGTDNFAKIVLEKLKSMGFLPSLIITTEDKPKGRKMILTPSEVKSWAKENKIDFLEPKTLKTDEVLQKIKSFGEFDVFIVASYGKIIPKNILDLPKHKTLNVHPSLLPKLRGPSPIESAILNEEETGVTIIVLDEEVDHGPILSQEKISIEWPPYQEDLEKETAKLGGEMLASILIQWINGEIKAVEQNHSIATFTKKIEKKDGEIDLADNPEKNLRKIRAFSVWPVAYFFKEMGGDKKRILIKKAAISEGNLKIEKVIPEGKKEMDFDDFIRGIKE